jgi:hypothetical protein
MLKLTYVGTYVGFQIPGLGELPLALVEGAVETSLMVLLRYVMRDNEHLQS